MDYIVAKNENQYVKFDHNKKVTHTSNITLDERFGFKEAKRLISNQIKAKDRSLYSIIENTFAHSRDFSHELANA